MEKRNDNIEKDSERPLWEPGGKPAIPLPGISAGESVTRGLL